MDVESPFRVAKKSPDAFDLAQQRQDNRGVLQGRNENKTGKGRKKKSERKERRDGLFFFATPLVFFFVCFISCLTSMWIRALGW